MNENEAKIQAQVQEARDKIREARGMLAKNDLRGAYRVLCAVEELPFWNSLIKGKESPV